jgi:CHASE2 domain-containing sensor protein/class 3 adenylate cyclase
MDDKPTRKKKRTRIERRLARSATALGIVLTCIIAAANSMGFLQSLEWSLSDRRTHYCQFHKTPTDQLVHVDIDDGAIDAIGRFPWQRKIVADIVDEISRAKPKVIAFDVIFTDPEEPSPMPQSQVLVDHDQALADAWRRCGVGVVGSSFASPPESIVTPQIQAAADVLCGDLELTIDELNDRLKVIGHDPVGGEQYIWALRAAMRTRLSSEPPGETDQVPKLAAKLLPHRARFGESLPSYQILAKQWLQICAEREMTRFSIPLSAAPSNVPRLENNTEKAPIPILTNASKFGGSVDRLPYPDGVVRGVPLFFEFQGRLYPQLGFVLACAALDADPYSPTLESDRVVIHRPDGKTVNIPVSVFHSPRIGDIGWVMTVPWFGTGPFKDMYLRPDGSGEHISISKFHDLADFRSELAADDQQERKALDVYLDAQVDLSLRDKLTQQHVVDDQAKRHDWIRQNILDDDFRKQGFEELARIATEQPGTLSASEVVELRNFRALQDIVEQTEVLNRRIQQSEAANRRAVEGRVVLIGETATGTTDMALTPMGASVPGVVTHGVILNGILTGDLWRQASPLANGLAIIIVGLASTILVVTLRPWRATLAVILLLLIYLVVNCLLLFSYEKYMLALAGPLAAAVLIWAMVILASVIVEATVRANITDRFRNRVDPQLVDYVLEDPDRIRLAGELKELTVVFTDLEGFTKASEQLGEKTVEVLNEYMERMVPIIRRVRSAGTRGGYLNKFLGDGIMFVFGAPFENPHHASEAVDTVMEMLEVTRQFSEEIVAKGLPPVYMRAGVTTGPMIVGDAGANVAGDYTVLGDAVNTAARLEKANKRFNSRVLINQGTALQLNGKFLLRPIGSLLLAGKSETVETFEVLGRREGATETEIEIARLSSEIVSKFTAGDEAASLELVKQMTAKFGPSKFAETYEHLCRHERTASDDSKHVVI